MPRVLKRVLKTSVLKQLKHGNLKLRIDKGKFCFPEVEYLGHNISNQGILPDSKKLDAVQNMQAPKNSKQLKSFLGLISYYRKFIPQCAKIFQPLVELINKNNHFRWENKHQQIFDMLKEKLVSPPILAYPDFSQPFILQTDASIDGIGAVLCQIGKDGLDHPIAYASRSLKPAESRYPITELETLAVVYFIKYFRSYLYQQEVIVYTDHTAIKAVLEKENSSSMMSEVMFLQIALV